MSTVEAEEKKTRSKSTNLTDRSLFPLFQQFVARLEGRVQVEEEEEETAAILVSILEGLFVDLDDDDVDVDWDWDWDDVVKKPRH